MASRKPTIALLYDFDKTLCTKDMQEYSFIPSIGKNPEEFWDLAGQLAIQEKMDRTLAYMYLMLDQSNKANQPIKRSTFNSHADGIEYYPGVEGWFDRINGVAEGIGATLEHYIISSGLKEIIEATTIAKHFRIIYASEYHYDQNDTAVWPKTAINYTGKTQYLFRINKGILDVSEDNALNTYVPDEKRPIPFRNMIYIGDGWTDVPCMKLVQVNGGCSIAVHNSHDLETAHTLLQQDRVNHQTPADYQAGSELEAIVKETIHQMTLAHRLLERTLEEKERSL